jgi:hypothetical protein
MRSCPALLARWHNEHVTDVGRGSSAWSRVSDAPTVSQTWGPARPARASVRGSPILRIYFAPDFRSSQTLASKKIGRTSVIACSIHQPSSTTAVLALPSACFFSPRYVQGNCPSQLPDGHAGLHQVPQVRCGPRDRLGLDCDPRAAHDAPSIGLKLSLMSLSSGENTSHTRA